MAAIPTSVVIFRPTAAQTLAAISQAEQAGVPTAWVPAQPSGFDPLTMFAAAAQQTSRIRLGTCIIPTYPRHPTALAAQALVLAELAPDRFSLGVGSSHPFIIEAMLGIPFEKPLRHLREYLTVLRALLWEGQVEFSGEFFRVQVKLPPGTPPARIPIPIAALRPGMFRLAGELADGAISAWCPAGYLRDVALPAMQAGADAAGRPRPPLVANVPVALTTDRDAVHRSARQALSMYQNIPAYQEMFAMAGFPLGPDGGASDELIDDLYVYGSPEQIAGRLRELHASGLDEIMVALSPGGPDGASSDEAALLELLGELARD